MKIFHNIEEWRIFRRTIPVSDSLGFAPTMGNLHIGHLSLFARSKRENDFTASSLFVNPTQFNQAEDYQNYPRTLEQDLELMEQAGVDFCLLPAQHEMYADEYRYQVQESQLCQLMEGKHRPGHFNGVLTVVLKLLHLFQPTRAYFGEKDYQQFELIKGMTAAFFMNIDILSCPTIREESGLAYSSRNNRLSSEEKKLAEQFATIFHQSKTCEQIIAELSQANIAVEYVMDYENRRYAAVYIGAIRLIDNYSIASSKDFK